ncbi:MAG: tetratricopeptide repeat protein, partial [Chitinophagales bacterium]
QANYYKRDFEEALTAHQYIISKYSEPRKKNSNSKKKKKKRTADNGEKKFTDNFKHQPVHHEASIWIVRSLIAQEKYADAQTALSVIKGKKDFPEVLYDELYAVEADLYMQQRQYTSAIEPLVKAIEYTKSKTLRARHYFILSQLYASEGNNTEAIASLNSVIKLKPDYVTDFYARLAIVQLSMENYGFSDAATLKTLTEMASSEKYKEFYSLLYYSLAEIELNKKNKEQGIAYLNLSVRNGDNDPEQKALSYLKLGDIYYQDIDYVTSYAYYDSSLITLPKEHERYLQTLERRDGLGELVKYLKIIETEKQLQYLASLNEWDLQKELDKILADQESKTAAQEFLESESGQKKEEETGGSSSFYFYNPTLKSKGFSEFRRVWGTRKLEDNWRRSDKSSISAEGDSEIAGEKTEVKETVDLSSDKITREQIIASLPTTDAKLQASNDKIATALYNAGAVYKQRFNQLPEARVQFTENITAYPDNAYELQALYQLYLIALNSNEKSAYQKT